MTGPLKRETRILPVPCHEFIWAPFWLHLAHQYFQSVAFSGSVGILCYFRGLPPWSWAITWGILNTSSPRLYSVQEAQKCQVPVPPGLSITVQAGKNSAPMACLGNEPSGGDRN